MDGAGLSLRWPTNLSHRLGWLGLCIHVCSRECLVGLGKQVKLPPCLSPTFYFRIYFIQSHEDARRIVISDEDPLNFSQFIIIIVPRKIKKITRKKC